MLTVFLVQSVDLDGWEETLGVFDTRDAAEVAANVYWERKYPDGSSWRELDALRVVPIPLNTLDW